MDGGYVFVVKEGSFGDVSDMFEGEVGVLSGNGIHGCV